MDAFYVYVLYRDEKLTQPFYVGKGSGHRYKKHAKEVTYGSANRHKLSIVKQCLANFGYVPYRIEYENLDEQLAFLIERTLITLWGRRDLGRGVLTNLTDGGEGFTGGRHTPERIAAFIKENKARVRTPEECAAISARQIGRKHSEETRAKMRAAKTPEARAKIGAANKARVRTPECRANMSEAAKRRDPTTRCTGIKRSEETKAKLREAHTRRDPASYKGGRPGVSPSDETRERMTLAQKARWAKRKEAAAMAAGA